MTGYNAYLFRMPAGIPGAVTRNEIATVEAAVITAFGQTGAPGLYGLAIVIDATTGKVRTPLTSSTDIYGWLVRPFPLQATSPGGDIGVAVPPTDGVCNVLKRGYMTVTLYGATASKKDGIIYIRINGADSTHPIGGAEAAADGGNTIALTADCYFMGPADALGNVEIAYKI